MHLSPDVWVRLRPSLPCTMPGNTNEALRKAVDVFETMQLRVVFADWRDWACSLGNITAQSFENRKGDALAFTIAGVVLNGHAIQRVLARRDVDTLELLITAGARLISQEIALTGLTFGRSTEIHTESQLREWAQQTAWPGEQRQIRRIQRETS